MFDEFKSLDWLRMDQEQAEEEGDWCEALRLQNLILDRSYPSADELIDDSPDDTF